MSLTQPQQLVGLVKLVWVQVGQVVEVKVDQAAPWSALITFGQQW